MICRHHVCGSRGLLQQRCGCIRFCVRDRSERCSQQVALSDKFGTVHCLLFLRIEAKQHFKLLLACSFGTSVGSGALSLQRAVLIAAVCEFSGAVSLGAGVRLRDVLVLHGL